MGISRSISHNNWKKQREQTKPYNPANLQNEFQSKSRNKEMGIEKNRIDSKKGRIKLNKKEKVKAKGKLRIPESCIAVELDVQAHKEKRSRGENGLPQAKGQTGARAH